MKRRKPDYAALGREGGAACVAARGVDFMREIGRKGGQTTLALHGREHFAAAGKKGGIKTHSKPERKPA